MENVVAGKKRIGKFPTKLTYAEFEEFYIAHPGMRVTDLAAYFGVSHTSINFKLNAFNGKNRKYFDPAISEMCKEAYRQGRNEGEDRGFEKGFLTGAGLGVGVGDLLKANGIGISDFIAGIAKVKKKGVV